MDTSVIGSLRTMNNSAGSSGDGDASGSSTAAVATATASSTSGGGTAVASGAAGTGAATVVAAGGGAGAGAGAGSVGHMTATGSRAAEYQAVVLPDTAGSLLYPLTEGSCKAMLPVALRPLVAYQLDLLEKSGFSEAIVVVHKDAAVHVTNYVESRALKTQIVVVENDAETGDALRAVADRITHDFVVIAGDLITEASMHSLADIHRTQDAAVTMLLKEREVDARGKAPIEDYFGLDDQSRVVILESEQDVEGIVHIHKRLSKIVPSITLRADLIDAHLYIFSHWVLELLLATPSLTSIKADLVPHLIRRQFRGDDALPSDIADRARSYQGIANTMSSSSGVAGTTDVVRCFAEIVPANGLFCARVRDAGAYIGVNREVATRAISTYTPWSKPPTPLTKYRDCVAGSNCSVGNKVTMKKCVLGNHTKISNGCKLSGCILFDHVTVGAGCVMQNSVIAAGSVIGPGCHVIDCKVGPTQTLDAADRSEARYKGEEIGRGGFVAAQG